MIEVHHLNNSRSQRILWLLEELELPYEVVAYQRDPETRYAPAALKEVHPLGKSPVIVDNGLVVAESGTIIDYLTRVSKPGALRPNEGSIEDTEFVFWLHYAEGSAMLPLLLALYVGFLGDAGRPLFDRIDSEIANNLSFMAARLNGASFFVGDQFSAADIQITFVLEAAASAGRLDDYPNLLTFIERMQRRPAYQRAVESGGPYKLGG